METRELHRAVATEWDYPSMRAGLDSHESGTFADSARIAEAMGRDDRIDACRATRTLAVVGLPFDMLPPDGRTGDVAKSLARRAKGLFFQSTPESVLRRIVDEGLMLGVSISDKIATRDGATGETFPALRPLAMEHVRVDPDAPGGYVLSTADGDVKVRRGDPRFFVYEPHGPQSWMGGAVRSLGLPWLVRQDAMRDWARRNEVHGQPVIKVFVPPGLSPEETVAFVASVRGMGRESVIFLPAPSEGQPGADVALLETHADDGDTFDHLITSCNVSIAIRLLGQNLTTEVQGGSYAAANAQERIRRDYLKADCESLSTALFEQVWRPWAASVAVNGWSLAPYPTWAHEPPDDVETRTKAQLAALDVIAKATALGIPIDIATLLETVKLGLVKGAVLPVIERPAPVETSAQTPPPGGEENAAA